MNILVIPDMHQHWAWADAIIHLYGDNHDRIVFLGDYWDTFSKDRGTIKQCCDWLDGMQKDLGDKAVWLVGNHDVAYMSQLWYNGNGAMKSDRLPYKCSGYSRNKANKIRSYWKDSQFFDNLILAWTCDDYVFSHAGLRPGHFKPTLTLDDNIMWWNDHFYEFKQNLKRNIYDGDIIWNCGACRGGPYQFGSPLWLDWNNEFIGIDGIKQIVGHTYCANPSMKDDNWNFDCGQTAFASIDTQKNNISVFSDVDNTDPI